MSPYPIQCFWHGPMSDLEILCLKSWVGHGHPVHLYSYQTITDLPLGVVLIDAREIIPEGPTIYTGPMHKTATKTAFEMLPFSDRFRFTLLRMNGGLWLDLDIILTKPIPDELFDQAFWCSSERTLQSGAYKSTDLFRASISAIYVAEPEHPLMCALTEWTGQAKDAWHGQKLFLKYLKKFNLKGVLQPSAFCDMNWWDVKSICGTVSMNESLPAKWGCKGTAVKVPEESLGVHLWRGQLRKHEIQTAVFQVSPLSYLGRLYRQAEEAYQERFEATSPQ